MAQLIWLHSQNKWVIGARFCGILLLLLINGTALFISDEILLVINECTVYSLSVSADWIT